MRILSNLSIFHSSVLKQRAVEGERFPVVLAPYKTTLIRTVRIIINQNIIIIIQKDIALKLFTGFGCGAALTCICKIDIYEVVYSGIWLI